MGSELVAAYDQQSAELTAAQDEIARLTMQVGQLEGEITEKSQALVSAEQERTACRTAVRETDARSVEIERKAVELRKELDHAHSEFANLRQAHADEMARLAAEAKEDVRHEREKAEQAPLIHDTTLVAAQLEIAKLARARKRKAAGADETKDSQNMTLPNV